MTALPGLASAALSGLAAAGTRRRLHVAGVVGVDGGQAADELIERLPVNHEAADALRVVRDYVGRPRVLTFLNSTLKSFFFFLNC